MKVFDVLSTMNPDALTSIQLETFSEPIAFGKVGAIKLNPKFDRFEVERIYPEYYKENMQTGITVIVKAVAG